MKGSPELSPGGGGGLPGPGAPASKKAHSHGHCHEASVPPHWAVFAEMSSQHGSWLPHQGNDPRHGKEEVMPFAIYSWKAHGHQLLSEAGH